MLFCAASGVFEGVSLLIVGDGWSDRDGGVMEMEGRERCLLAIDRF